MAKSLALVLGIFYLIAGVWGFFSPVTFGVLSTNWLHSIIHVAFGIGGLVASRGTGTRPYLMIVGWIVLVAGALRFVPGVSALVVSLFNINYPVAVLNIVIGVIALAVVMSDKRQSRPAMQ